MKWGLVQIASLTVLLVIAITSFIWLDQPDSTSDPDELKMAELKADYYLEEFETIRYDKQGNPEYRLLGETLLHYPAHQASEIINPKLSLNRPNQPSWSMTSKSGWLEEATESFRLNGDVAILRGPHHDQPEMIINTSEVLVRTKQQTIETESEIEIHSPDWILRSTGLKSDLTNGKLSLLSNVRARYETN